MKLSDVEIILSKKGSILNATAFTVNTKVALNLFLLKKEFNRVHEDIKDKVTGLLKECGITDDEFAVDADGVTRRYSPKANEKGEKDYSKWVKFLQMQDEYLKGEAAIKVPEISFAECYAIRKENYERTKGDKEVIDLTYEELILENIFWENPDNKAHDIKKTEAPK